MGQDEGMKKRPASAVEHVAQILRERAAKRERALAEYERIVARLRQRAPRTDEIRPDWSRP